MPTIRSTTMVSQIENEKWINVKVCVSRKKFSSAELQKSVEIEANTLQWAIKKEDEWTILQPRQDGKLSPKQLQKQFRSIFESVERLRAIVFDHGAKPQQYVVVENAPANATLRDLRARKMALQLGDFLLFEFPMSKRLQLEEKNLSLAKYIFRGTLVEEMFPEKGMRKTIYQLPIIGAYYRKKVMTLIRQACGHNSA